MIGRRFLPILLALLLLPALAGCKQEYGKVIQGRVVEFDKDKRQITFVTEVAHDWKNPRYKGLPPVSMTLPADPAEMGPEPKAGGRIELDLAGNKFIIYDKATQAFKDVPFTLVDSLKGVEGEHPLLMDAASGQPKKFPVVDKEKKTITVYSKRQKLLTVAQVADEYLALPVSTWDAGDEIRAYYLVEGKIQRFMNMTKTDIFKK
jgi:hypothetical protein